MRPTDHSASRPIAPAPADPLADSSPETLAVAYLLNHRYATAERYDDDFGKERFRNIKPTELRHWRQEFHRYARCVYERFEIEDLRSSVNEFLIGQRFFGKDGGALRLRVTEALKHDVLGMIRDLCQARVASMPTWIDGRPLPAPRDIIAFRNGLLDIQEWLRDPETPLIPSTPLWFSHNVLSCTHDLAAKCTLFLKFIGEALEGKADLIRRVQEYLGYCLTGDTSFQRLLWMHGPSGSGKSTMAMIFEAVIGAHNTASVNLWDFAEQFGLEDLLGMRLAIVSDAHLGHTGDAEKVQAKLKQLTGGDKTRVNRKHLKALRNVELMTRFVIVTNEFPTFSDASDAIARRTMFVPFNQTFKENADRTLPGRLLQEIPGITMWALEGLHRLLMRGDFEEAPSADDTTDDFRRLQSPVLAFVEDTCQRPGEEGAEQYKPDEFVATKDAMHKRFVAWAKDNERAVMSKDRFATKLMRVCPGVTVSRPWEDGRRIHVFKGIRLRTPTDNGP